ncbi:MAG: hypothetical protein ABGW78_07225, partial [Pirellulales bacterium]
MPSSHAFRAAKISWSGLRMFVACCIAVSFGGLGLCQHASAAEQDATSRIDQRYSSENVTTGSPFEEAPDFRRHVVPLMGRLGCNGRACHGSFQGQGGF